MTDVLGKPVRFSADHRRNTQSATYTVRRKPRVCSRDRGHASCEGQRTGQHRASNSGKHHAHQLPAMVRGSPKACRLELNSHKPTFDKHLYPKTSLSDRHPFQEEADAPVQRPERLVVSPLDLLRSSVNGGWIGDAPMYRHRLAGPERTHFFRCVVAHRKDKTEMGCFGCRELIPRLAACVCGTQPRPFDLTNGFRPHRSGRMAARAVGSEVAPPLRFMIASAMMERAELPVHRNRTL